jgi:hypothetical protein
VKIESELLLLTKMIVDVSKRRRGKRVEKIFIRKAVRTLGKGFMPLKWYDAICRQED